MLTYSIVPVSFKKILSVVFFWVEKSSKKRRIVSATTLDSVEDETESDEMDVDSEKEREDEIDSGLQDILDESMDSEFPSEN